MNVDDITFIIEQSIADLGVDPALCRGEKPRQWSIAYKGSTVWIDLFNFPQSQTPDKYYFQIMSPLVAIPDRNKEDFFKSCLEINHLLYGCAISIKADWTYVLSLREAENLDRSEIDATLDRVAFYSADYHGKLGFKFEGSWDPKPTDKPINSN